MMLSTQEFPGSLACALSMIDRNDAETQFTVYTDDLPGLQAHVQALNTVGSEFKIHLNAIDILLN